MNYKNILMIVFGIAFAAQLSGCLFVDGDGHRHYGHGWHHERSSSLNVHVGG